MGYKGCPYWTPLYSMNRSASPPAVVLATVKRAKSSAVTVLLVVGTAACLSPKAADRAWVRTPEAIAEPAEFFAVIVPASVLASALITCERIRRILDLNGK